MSRGIISKFSGFRQLWKFYYGDLVFQRQMTANIDPQNMW